MGGRNYSKIREAIFRCGVYELEGQLQMLSSLVIISGCTVCMAGGVVSKPYVKMQRGSPPRGPAHPRACGEQLGRSPTTQPLLQQHIHSH